MNRIRPWLYVGKYRDTIDTSYLQAHNIGAMLQLAESVKQPDIKSLYLAVDDGVSLPVEMLEWGVAFVRAQKAEGKSVLVACGAGISRSVTFAMAALHEEENIPLIEAFKQIVMARPEAMPHPALVESLQTYYHDPITYDDIWRELKHQE